MTIPHAILLVVLLVVLQRVPPLPGSPWVDVLIAALIIVALLLRWV